MFDKVKKIGGSVISAMGAVMTSLVVASATTGTGLGNRIDGVLNLFQSDLMIIGRRVGILAIIMCAIKYAMASDAQSAKTAKDWAIKIAIGVIALYSAEAIMNILISVA